jgi:hypothetical protein
VSIFSDAYPNRNPGVMAYWGSILASAQAGLNVTDTWQAIRDAQATYGAAAPRPDAADVSALRRFANEQVAADRALAAALPGDVIDRSYMAVGPYSQSTVQGLGVEPTYQVRYLNTIQLSDGSTVDKWQTSVFGASDMQFGRADLQATIEANASELAAQGAETSTTTPKGTSLGVANLSITVV